MFSKQKSAFSLVEMSVVLIIIGLIASGVFTAHAQIKTQALIKTVIEQVSVLAQATNNFREKYGAWPGDYKGFVNSGNGDGIINVTGLYSGNERVAAFVHLYRAGMYSGDYSGVWGTEPFAPNGPVVNSKYFYGSDYLTNTLNSIGANQVITLAGYNVPGVSAVAGSYEIPVLSAYEMLVIDEKIDDGYPSTGVVIGNSDIALPACYLSTIADPNKVYDVTDVGRNCVLYFLMGN